MTNSLSVTIDNLLGLRADADRRAEALGQQRIALESEYRQRIEKIDRDLAVARAEAAAYGHALDLVEPLTAESGGTRKMPVRRDRRKRGMSPFWRRCFAGMPVAPEPSVHVQEVYAIVHRIDPDVPENNVRSQLNAAKGRGDVELVNGGWRLTRPLNAPSTTQNKATHDGASDTEVSEADVPEASESNAPQPWVTTDAAD